jgi:hypothetical protein
MTVGIEKVGLDEELSACEHKRVIDDTVQCIYLMILKLPCHETSSMVHISTLVLEPRPIPENAARKFLIAMTCISQPCSGAWPNCRISFLQVQSVLQTQTLGLFSLISKWHELTRLRVPLLSIGGSPPPGHYLYSIAPGD